MTCPRCYKDDVSIVGDTHYVCNNPVCIGPDGKRTQFYIVNDERKEFPYSQIFLRRQLKEFFKKQYLQVLTDGSTSI